MARQGTVATLVAPWRRIAAAVSPPMHSSYWATRRAVTRALAPELGQSMVEYAIVLALVALVAMVAIQALGTGVASVFTNILSRVQGLPR